MLIGFHHKHLALLTAIIIAGLGGSTVASADSPYFGRWTVSDDKPAFSAKGKIYKTFDVAPCGADFCGVSVDNNETCGATLFRFLTVHAGNDELVGHGHWGAEKKKLIIDHTKPETGPEGVYLALGSDDMDPTAREGSMPSFEANYKRLGDAKCSAK